MMDAVVLAAGYGSRLSPYIGNRPKPLAPLKGTPLIEWILKGLEHMASPLRRVVVVTGHRCQVLITHLTSLQAQYGFEIVPVISSEFRRGNGASLCAAENCIGTGPFLLLMGDHIVDPGLIEAVIRAKNMEEVDVALATDRTPFFFNREHDLPTKVLLDSQSSIQDIGKRIPKWNCIDTGVFLMRRTIFPALKSFEGEKQTITGGVKQLIQTQHSAVGVDVSGMFWSDVDTHEDLVRTEVVLRNPFWGTSQFIYGSDVFLEEEVKLEE